MWRGLSRWAEARVAKMSHELLKRGQKAAMERGILPPPQQLADNTGVWKSHFVPHHTASQFSPHAFPASLFVITWLSAHPLSHMRNASLHPQCPSIALPNPPAVFVPADDIPVMQGTAIHTADAFRWNCNRQRNHENVTQKARIKNIKWHVMPKTMLAEDKKRVSSYTRHTAVPCSSSPTHGLYRDGGAGAPSQAP